MSKTDARPQPERSVRRTTILSAAVLVAVVAVGFVGWSYTCPCDRAPGAYLFGAEVDAPVTDWTFANQVRLCQIQITTGLLPHAINLNCMSTPTGQLYLSCSQCETKRWSNAAVEDGRARLRLDGTVYPVTVRRVLDPAELDQAWRARVAKLQVVGGTGTPTPPPDARRPDGWWSFRVASRS